MSATARAYGARASDPRDHAVVSLQNVFDIQEERRDRLRLPLLRIGELGGECAHLLRPLAILLERPYGFEMAILYDMGIKPSVTSLADGDGGQVQRYLVSLPTFLPLQSLHVLNRLVVCRVVMPERLLVQCAGPDSAVRPERHQDDPLLTAKLAEIAVGVPRERVQPAHHREKLRARLLQVRDAQLPLRQIDFRTRVTCRAFSHDLGHALEN